MKYNGTVRQVMTTKNQATLILDTEIGLRGIELERAEWVHLLRRTGETDPQALTGWAVEYDPEHDILNLIDPGEAPGGGDEVVGDAGGAGDTEDAD